MTTTAIATDQFDIPQAVQEKHPELVSLILETRSMDDQERQYWFHILPVMDDEQVNKLRGILENEKEKLAEIDRKYSGTDEKPEVEALAEDFITNKMMSIQAKEAEARAKEAEREAELLEQLQSL